MAIYFGENLKRLRKEKMLTQETLAEFLGVSFQAVSKWERNETYPDITMLPSIASFFDVTTDELLGIDKAKKQQKTDEYVDLYDKMRLKDISLTFSEFQKAVKEFPGEFSLLIRYMELLGQEKDHVHLPDYEKTSRELMSIYENIQSHCRDDSIRIWSKRLISEHLMRKYQCTCNDDGKYCCHTEYMKKAKSIIDEMPSIENSREYLTATLCETENQIELYMETIGKFLYYLQTLITGYCYYDYRFSPEYKIKVAANMNSLFELIFTDGDFGKNWLNVVYNFGHLGHWYFENGDNENAIKYLKIAAEYAIKCDALPDSSGRAARFYETSEFFRDMDMRTRMTLLMKKHYPLSDEFRSLPEFREIIAMLGDIDVEGFVL